MENLEIQEVLFKVNLNRVGVKENFFGHIIVNEKIFDFNFFTPYPANQLETIDFRKNKDFFNSIDLVLFNKKAEEIDLELKEFLLFYTVIIISIITVYKEFEFFYYFQINIFLTLPKKTIQLLNQPKFDCRINC
jgi:hypothetical protein